MPRSRQTSEHEVLVHWGLEEARLLNNLKLRNVPSPILGKYKWPGMFKPFLHQQDTSSFLTLNKRAFCFSQQGTGKSASVIWAADYLLNNKAVKRVLIIAPLSIMDVVWRAEIFKLAMHRRVEVAFGSAEKRRKIIASDAEFVIINYDGVGVVQKEIMEGGFDLIVCDECFVAGTLVSTPRGKKRIETLQAGDEVLTSSGVANIKTTTRTFTKLLVEVVLGNSETITCTPDHPFFTDAGWVAARNLKGRHLISCADVSDMRNDVRSQAPVLDVATSAQHQRWVSLLKILRAEEVQQAASRDVLLSEDAELTTQRAEASEERRASQETIGYSESEWTQTESSGWKRHWNDTHGEIDSRGLTCGVGMELPRSVGEEATRLSYMLQAGLCQSEYESGIGGGWEQPPAERSKTAGHEERAEVVGVRVESVTYIECADPTPVYNLQVEGTPNYFVGNNWLVHNCNYLKNASTSRWKSVAKLITPDTWLWMLTGTPAAQSPMDAYGLAKLVNPTAVPRFMSAYRDMVMVKLTMFKWAPRLTAPKIVHQVLQPAIRYTKEECLDLPEMLYASRHVPLTAQQKVYYDKLKKDMTMVAAGEVITAVNAAVHIGRLLQVASGASYTDNGKVVEFDVTNRVTVLLEVIEESSNKVLVFVPYRHTIDVVKDKLLQAGVKVDVIHGDVALSKRTEIFKAFQLDDTVQVLLIQPQTVAHGVTLTAANTVVWWGPIPSCETYEQANARVHRQGQHNPCTVVHLEGSPVERHIYSLLQQKLDVHTQVVDLYKNADAL